MRINKMITQDEIYHQILSNNSLRKCIEIGQENLYVDFGA